MTTLQKQTLENFINSYGKRTYDEYSKLTGIERTRLFRIFQGAEMKLFEFEVFQTLLLKTDTPVTDWKSVIEEAQEDDLQIFFSKEIKEQITRTKRMQDYLEQSLAA